jgi:hypothetical protein
VLYRVKSKQLHTYIKVRAYFLELHGGATQGNDMPKRKNNWLFSKWQHTLSTFNYCTGNCVSEQMSFCSNVIWSIVFLSNVPLGLWVNVFLGNCFSREMSFWANVFWANVFMGKCLYGQMTSRQMSSGQMS